MSVGQYLSPDYRVLKTEPAPSTQQARRRMTDRPSTLLLMTLGFQEPVAAHADVLLWSADVNLWSKSMD